MRYPEFLPEILVLPRKKLCVIAYEDSKSDLGCLSGRLWILGLGLELDFLYLLLRVFEE